MRLQLIAHATSAIGEVGETNLGQRGASGSGKGELNSLFGPDIFQNARHHGVEDLLRDLAADEVEDDNVLANAVK